jgi:hypothetical protein
MRIWPATILFDRNLPIYRAANGKWFYGSCIDLAPNEVFWTGQIESANVDTFVETLW